MESFQHVVGAVALLLLTISTLVSKVIVDYPYVLVGLVLFYIGYRIGRR